MDVDQTWQAWARVTLYRTDQLLVVIPIHVWIPDHFFIFFTTAE